MHFLDSQFELLHLLLVIIIWKLEINLVAFLRISVDIVKVAIASDSTSKVHVLLHYSGTFGVNGAEIRVLEKGDDVRFSCFL